ncbi:MAG TPA: hypothetical protein VGL77_08620 [Armatimonadota bacterium]|jgi:multidrug transporter EmrE-like cation transporter
MIHLFAVFMGMQTAAMLLFKYGSAHPSRWLPSFILANVIGITSTWILMVIYKQLNVNVAMGVAMGGSFLVSQITLALVFRNALSPLQLLAILAIGGGMFTLCLGARV